MNLISTTRRKLTLAATAAALVTGALAAPAANAFGLPGLGVGPSVPAQSGPGAGGYATGACDNAALTQPFLPWGDSAQYKVVPGGTFEGSTSGWTFSGGASVIADRTARGGHAVSLPNGASLETPFTCVNASYPTLRTLARGGTVNVQVIYREVTGNMSSVAAGAINPNNGWAPSPLMQTNAIIAGVHTTSGNASIALRFTAVHGSAAIDDVYIDPRMR